MRKVRIAVYAILALFGGYGLARALGSVAAAIGRNRSRFPRFVVRFFNRLDAILLRLTRLPQLPTFERRKRVNRAQAACTAYHNPLEGRTGRSRAEIEQVVAHAYGALCALAADLGAPRKPGQTPYEFIETLPKELKPIEDIARELTELYVRAAYSTLAMQDRVEDRLRHFWIRYERLRRRYLK